MCNDNDDIEKYASNVKKESNAYARKKIITFIDSKILERKSRINEIQQAIYEYEMIKFSLSTMNGLSLIVRSLPVKLITEHLAWMFLP